MEYPRLDQGVINDAIPSLQGSRRCPPRSYVLPSTGILVAGIGGRPDGFRMGISIVMVVPLVIIHFRLGFSLTKPSSYGVPPFVETRILNMDLSMMLIF